MIVGCSLKFTDKSSEAFTEQSDLYTDKDYTWLGNSVKAVGYKFTPYFSDFYLLKMYAPYIHFHPFCNCVLLVSISITSELLSFTSSSLYYIMCCNTQGQLFNVSV